MTFSIKKGDTSPALRATLRYDDCTIINLTNATAIFRMRQAGTTSVLINAAAVIVSVAGIVEYRWSAPNTATVGAYDGEFVVTYANGKVETFPSDGFIAIEIVDSIA